MSDEQRATDSPTPSWQPPPPAGGHPFERIHEPSPAKPAGPPIALALGAVGLVVALGVLLAFALLSNEPGPSPTASLVARSPSPTPTATATASASTPSTAPSPSPATSGSPAVGRTPPPDIAAQIEQVTREVLPLRELDELRDVHYVLLTREEATRELLAQLAADVDEREIETEERLLQRLGLLPEDSDLLELFSELYTATVAAYYRPDNGTFYVIERDEPFGALDRMFVAHEYTHALQDQHFDLEGTRLKDDTQGDAQLAQLAAIEGDASVVMYIWAFSNLSPGEQGELYEGLTPTEQEVLDRMPPILRRQLGFPYNEGFLFSSEVFALGGWDAINRTLSEPPVSTEQILHPQSYLQGHQPIEVEPADWLDELGDGWSIAYEQTMGELNTQIWLADGEDPPLIPLPGQDTEWQRAAAGWGGDRLRMYEHDGGRWAIAWDTKWDTDADEQEFVELVRPLLERLGHPAFVADTPPGLTSAWLCIASDEQVLQTFLDLASP